MQKVLISFLWAVNFFCLTHCNECHFVGSPTNAREFVIRVRNTQQVAICDGFSVFDPESCACQVPGDGCNMRPLSSDGSIFQQHTLAGEWINMTCAGGTIFIRSKCRCDYVPDVPVSECYKQKLKHKTKYLVRRDNRQSVMDCPPRQVYDPIACGCIERQRDCKSRLRREDPFGYTFEMDVGNNSWMPMECPKGLVFNQAKCQCDW